MLKERQTRIELIASLASLGLLGVALFTAFSRKTKHEIGRRDDWECRQCDRRFDRGWMVTVAHYDHDRNDPGYDNAETGRVLCICCHASEEIFRGNIWGAQKLLDMGLYTKRAEREMGRNIYLTVQDIVRGVVE